MLSSLQLKEANEQYLQLEEQVEYIRSLQEFIRSYFNVFTAESEALEILVRG